MQVARGDRLGHLLLSGAALGLVLAERAHATEDLIVGRAAFVKLVDGRTHLVLLAPEYGEEIRD